MANGSHIDSLEFRLERLKQISHLSDELYCDFFNVISQNTQSGMDIYWNYYVEKADEFHLHFNAVRPFCLTYRADIGYKGHSRSCLSDDLDVESAAPGG